MAELVGLLQDHRDAGSALATRLLDAGDVGDVFWLVEPVAVVAPVVDAVPAAAVPAAIPNTATAAAG